MAAMVISVVKVDMVSSALVSPFRMATRTTFSAKDRSFFLVSVEQNALLPSAFPGRLKKKSQTQARWLGLCLAPRWCLSALGIAEVNV